MSQVVQIEQDYTICLETTTDSISCSKELYRKIDSLLNFFYQELKNTCNGVQKENLKDEELDWLSKRDKYFKSNLVEFQKIYPFKTLNSVLKSDTLTRALQMLALNTAFVKQRIIELANAKNDDYSPSNYEVNITGFYQRDGSLKKKDGDIFGYSGDVLVKQISANEAVIRLYVCKGAPSYNSGIAFDTLQLKQNECAYRFKEDPSCNIRFCFFKRGIKVEEQTADFNCGCGFGHAVSATGFYRKTSSKTPKNEDLLAN